MRDSQQLIAAIWSISEGRGSGDELELLRADERASLSVLDRLILETEEDLAVVRNLPGEERDQVVADFTDTLDFPGFNSLIGLEEMRAKETGFYNS